MSRHRCPTCTGPVRTAADGSSRCVASSEVLEWLGELEVQAEAQADIPTLAP